MAIVEIIYLIISVLIRGYNTTLDNVGVVSCVLTECFAIGLPIASRLTSIPDNEFIILVFVMIGMLFFSISATTLRTYFVMKNVVVQLIK